jgi:Transposase DDE domain
VELTDDSGTVPVQFMYSDAVQDANESHDWRIFADFAQGLIATARPLHACDLMGVDLHQSLYALDSTTIDLCLSLFPWAKFRQRKAAVKMHTLLDLHGNIPTFIHVTSGAVHDVNVLDEIMPEAEAAQLQEYLKSATDPQEVAMVKKYLAELAGNRRK